MPTAIYPYGDWINAVKRGETVTLFRGTDFDCEPYAMAGMIRNSATRFNKWRKPQAQVRIAVKVYGDFITLENRRRNA